jgi:SAM-dependent methyltransferase
MKQASVISHGSNDSFEKITQDIRLRIESQGDKPHATVAEQLALLEGLKHFPFGRFLIENKGINGFWTDYMLTHPWRGRKTGKNPDGESFGEVESFILNKAPLILGTQQRFEIFLKENQEQVENGARLASIPCGLMGELLYLDYQNIDEIELIGIDLDKDSLKHAERIAKEKQLSSFVELKQGDAWSLGFDNELDLISSNGLTIYEPSDDKVTKLYQLFYQALKPAGKLVTSFVTPPSGGDEPCEWKMDLLNQNDLLKQKIIFADVLEAKWQCYRSSKKVKQQLTQAGFKEIEFIYDMGHCFPTVVAIK